MLKKQKWGKELNHNQISKPGCCVLQRPELQPGQHAPREPWQRQRLLKSFVGRGGRGHWSWVWASLLNAREWIMGRVCWEFSDKPFSSPKAMINRHQTASPTSPLINSHCNTGWIPLDQCLAAGRASGKPIGTAAPEDLPRWTGAPRASTLPAAHPGDQVYLSPCSHHGLGLQPSSLLQFTDTKYCGARKVTCSVSKVLDQCERLPVLWVLDWSLSTHWPPAGRSCLVDLRPPCLSFTRIHEAQALHEDGLNPLDGSTPDAGHL